MYLLVVVAFFCDYIIAYSLISFLFSWKQNVGKKKAPQMRRCLIVVNIKEYYLQAFLFPKIENYLISGNRCGIIGLKECECL